jgi:RNA polymerase sigma-70 factor (ECF subfamily)
MDTQLVTRAQQGDEAAFAELTVAVGGRLHRIAYSILRDRGLAEDATQQALLKIWRKLPGLREPARFEAWSYRFVVHACYAEAKHAKRTLPELAMRTETIAPDEVGLVDDRDQLERGFKRLSVDHRAVIVLHHYVGLPLPEVAATLGIPLGTAHSRLDRAMTKLRSALRADGPPAEATLQEVAP